MKAQEVAYWFLARLDKAGEKCSQLKLQRLCYFAQGWYLAFYNVPLIEETLITYKWGPAFPSLYKEFAEFGSGAIEGKYSVKLDRETEDFLERIFDVYIRFITSEMCAVAMKKGGPWDQVHNCDGNQNEKLVIPQKLITEYFTQLKS